MLTRARSVSSASSANRDEGSVRKNPARRVSRGSSRKPLVEVAISQKGVAKRRSLGKSRKSVASTEDDDESLTPAEMDRKAILEGDNMVLDGSLQASSLVCSSCGRCIQLSKKSKYDASHWKRHRGSCGSSPKDIGRPSQLCSIAQTPRASGSESSLTSTVDRDASSEMATAEDSADESTVVVKFTPENARNYWTITQRQCTTHIGYWRDWTWSQVKEPVFPRDAPQMMDDAEDGDYDYDYDYDSHDEIQFLAPVLFPLFH